MGNQRELSSVWGNFKLLSAINFWGKLMRLSGKSMEYLVNKQFVKHEILAFHDK